MEYFIVLQKILFSENLTMGDFLIKGCHTQNSNGASREYKIVNYDLQDSHKLIKQAVMSRKEINHKRGQSRPVVHKGYEPISMSNSIHKILASHPFPYLQGPLIVQLDSSLTDSDILNAKTIFRHAESQKCGKWTPTKSGLQGWGIFSSSTLFENEDGTYNVNSQEDINIHGPASSKANLNLIYTCQFQRCTIECPCKICMEGKKSCKGNCDKNECRHNQCQEHDLKLP